MAAIPGRFALFPLTLTFTAVFLPILFLLDISTVGAQAPVLLYSLASGMDEPDGIALDPTEQFVYVADKDNWAVRKFNLSGTQILQWSVQLAHDVAVDPSGNVYVMHGTTTPIAYFISKYTPQGSFIRSIPPPAGHDIVGGAVAVDSQARVYFALTSYNGYAIVDSTGVLITKVPSASTYLKVDEFFDVWLVGGSQIQHYSGGVLVGSFGSAGSGDGQFQSPRRVAFGADGLVYVPDYLLNRVQAFTRAGAYQFQFPSTSAYAIVADSSNRFYVTSHAGGSVTVYGDAVTYDLTITPTDTLMTSGTIGGPFAGSRQFRILNAGADTVSFTATPQQSWIQASGATSGSLAPGDSAFMTATIGGTANGLALGTYIGSVRFDQTDPIPLPALPPNHRYVRLTVTPPPVYVLDLAVTPVDTVFSAGFAGGPFTPPSAVYTITNNGADSTSYSISESDAWLDLTGNLTGRLPAGGFVQVTAGLTGTAAGLSPGRYVSALSVQQTNPVPNQGPTGLTRLFVLDVNALPPSALVIETGDFYSAGPVGGPFAPASQSYWITTLSISPIAFNVSATESWFTITGETSGSVTAGDTAVVSVQITAAANSLPEDVHIAPVLFSQTSPQALPTTRNVYLAVGNVPVLEVNSIIPSTGITTAFAGGTPDTVLLVGVLLSPTSTVTFGSRPATVIWNSTNEDSLRVVLPWHPPGLDCAAATTIPVTVTVTNGPFTDTIPFTYTIVKHLVPEVYASIQAAITASRPGVCVSAAPGTYLENLVLDAGISGITVTSRTQDLGETTIQGGGNFTPVNPAVTFDGTGAETILIGFQIILGNTGVVVRNGASPSIIRNFINNNYASGDGGGVRVESGCAPILSNNRIDLNSAAGDGGGLAIINGMPTLDDNNINLNVTEGDGGGLYLSRMTAIQLNDVRLYGNAAGGSGGGAYLRSTANVAATGLEVVGNGAVDAGGGLYCVSESQSVSLDNLVVDGNRSETKGGGCYVDAANGAGTLRNSTISDNLALYEGGGLYLGAGTDVTARNNLINSNTADSSHAGGIYVSDGVLIDITSNEIRDNDARQCGSRGGGVHIPNFVVGDVDSNLIAGNEGWVGGGISFGRKCRINARRNVVAYNSASGDTCRETMRATGGEMMLDRGDTASVGPGILVDDSGVNLINNTIHGNQQTVGGPHGGGIHGRRTGAFAPDWINNIVSNNSGWGIQAHGVNSAAIIDYNLGYQNALGNFSPTIHIPGEPPFANNIAGDPLYVGPNSVTLDFHLSNVTSPAVDNGSGPDDPDNTPTDIGAFYFDQFTGAVPGGGPNPSPLSVLSVVPNPFRQQVTVTVSTERLVPVSVDVFDIAGRRLSNRQLDLSAGTHELTWDGLNANGAPAPAGIYFCRLTSGGWQHVDKLVLLR